LTGGVNRNVQKARCATDWGTFLGAGGRHCSRRHRLGIDMHPAFAGEACGSPAVEKLRSAARIDPRWVSVIEAKAEISQGLVAVKAESRISQDYCFAWKAAVFTRRSPESVLAGSERLRDGAFPGRILVLDHRHQRRECNQRPGDHRRSQ
jgi:hypothetical protein